MNGKNFSVGQPSNMSIHLQRLIFIGLFLTIFLEYQTYAPQKSSFPCETILYSPIHTLDSEYVREIGSKSRFISWVKDWYGIQPQEEGPRINWEKDGIHYQAHFTDVNLELIAISVSPFETKVKDVTACFGTPSTSSAITIATDRGIVNLSHLWYNDLRISVTGTAPTEAPVGTQLSLDENADVPTVFLYTIPAYERYKP